MVSPVNTSAINSLLRSQSGSAPALKTTSAAAQAIIDQLRRPTPIATTTAATSTTQPSSSLPRGSLVNLLV